MFAMDSYLGNKKRFYCEQESAIVLGSTGERMWAAYLLGYLGLVGSFNILHWTDITSLVLVRIFKDDKEVSYKYRDHSWFPSHTDMFYESNEFEINESKFVTNDDCAIALIKIKSLNKKNIDLKIEIESSLFSEWDDSNYLFKPLEFHYVHRLNETVPKNISRSLDEWKIIKGDGLYILTTNMSLFGNEFNFIVAVNLEDTANNQKHIFTKEIESGREAYFKVLFSVDTDAKNNLKKIKKWYYAKNPLRNHIHQYNNWFEKNVPFFECNNKYIEKAWHYRWFLLKRNLHKPGLGRSPGYCFYEGAHSPLFSAFIGFSSPLHIIEARWIRDPIYCWDEIKTLANSFSLVNSKMEENDECRTVALRHFFLSWGIAAIWKAYLVHPNKEMTRMVLKDCLDYNEKATKGWDKVIIENKTGDNLPIITSDGWLGREYSPSFRYFNNYRADVALNDVDKKVESVYCIPTKAVDAASYHYANLMALADIVSELNLDSLSKNIRVEASKIKKSVSKKMWDKKTGYFYDIRGFDDKKALVKMITGFFPYWAEMFEGEFLGIFEHLNNKEFLSDINLVPSVSMDEFSYRSDNTWFGHFIHNCTWNGTSWPYMTSHLIESIGNAVEFNPDLRALFKKVFVGYTLNHFISDNINNPVIFECYNPETGEHYGNIQDYFHSYYIDLVIRYIGGLRPRNDGKIELNPIDIGLDYFVLDNIPYKNNNIKITWKNVDTISSSNSKDGIIPGYSLYVNNKLVLNKKKLEKNQVFSISTTSKD